MSNPIITSRQNQRIKDALKLRERRQRDRQGRTLIDGMRENHRAVESGVTLAELFYCPSLCDAQQSESLLSMLRGQSTLISEVTPEVFEKLAFGDRTEGVVGIAELPKRTLADLDLPEGALVAVLEGVEKPGNVGAVLRSADAAGVSALVLADSATDLYNPNTIRASLGTVFTVPVCTATSAETLTWLKRAGLSIYAARTDTTRSYTTANLRTSVAIVLGSEADGLAPLWNVEGVTPIGLPMLGAADSLNVSATAAVLFYEALRQRSEMSQAVDDGR